MGYCVTFPNFYSLCKAAVFHIQTAVEHQQLVVMLVHIFSGTFQGIPLLSSSFEDNVVYASSQSHMIL